VDFLAEEAEVPGPLEVSQRCVGGLLDEELGFLVAAAVVREPPSSGEAVIGEKSGAVGFRGDAPSAPVGMAAVPAVEELVERVVGEAADAVAAGDRTSEDVTKDVGLVVDASFGSEDGAMDVVEVGGVKAESDGGEVAGSGEEGAGFQVVQHERLGRLGGGGGRS